MKSRILFLFLGLVVLSISVFSYDLTYVIKSESEFVPGVTIILSNKNSIYTCETNDQGSCILFGVLGSSSNGNYDLSILKDGYVKDKKRALYIQKSRVYNYDIVKKAEDAWKDHYYVENGFVKIRLKVLDDSRNYEVYDSVNTELVLDYTSKTGYLEFNKEIFGGVFVKKIDDTNANWGQIPAKKNHDTYLKILPGGRITVQNIGNDVEICVDKARVSYKGKDVTINTFTCLNQDKSYNAIPKDSEGQYYIYSIMEYNENGIEKTISLKSENFTVGEVSVDKKVPPYINLNKVYINNEQIINHSKLYSNESLTIRIEVNDLDGDISDLKFSHYSEDFSNINDYQFRKITEDKYEYSWNFLDATNGYKELFIKVKDKDNLTDILRVGFNFKVVEYINIDSFVPNSNNYILQEDTIFKVNVSGNYMHEYSWYVDDKKVSGSRLFYLTKEVCNKRFVNITFKVAGEQINKSISWTVDCNLDNILIKSLKPSSKIVQLKLSEGKYFDVSYSHELGDELSHKWVINDNVIEDNKFLFKASDFGVGKHVIELLIFKVDNVSMNKSIKYDVIIIDDTKIKEKDLELTNYYPKDNLLFALVDSELNFNITTNKKADVLWKVNGVDVSKDVYLKYIFDKVGVYSIKVIVSDGIKDLEKEWTVDISGTYSPFIVEGLDKFDSTITKSALSEINIDLSIKKGSFEPTYFWSFNDEKEYVDTFSMFLTCDDVGNHDLKFHITDGITTKNYDFILEVKDHPDCSSNRNIFIKNYSVDLKDNFAMVKIDLFSNVLGDVISYKVNNVLKTTPNTVGNIILFERIKRIDYDKEVIINFNNDKLLVENNYDDNDLKVLVPKKNHIKKSDLLVVKDLKIISKPSINNNFNVILVIENNIGFDYKLKNSWFNCGNSIFYLEDILVKTGENKIYTQAWCDNSGINKLEFISQEDILDINYGSFVYVEGD